MSVGLGGGEHLDDARAHRAGDLRLVERSHVAGIAGGGGEERDLEGFLEQLMVVAAEHRDIRGIDHRVRAERVGLMLMEGVHRSAGLAGEEGGGTAVVFLLRAFAGQEAAAGHGRRGEVEDDRAQAGVVMATGDRQGSRLNHLDDGGVVARPGEGVAVVGREVRGPGDRRGDVERDIHLPAGGRGVKAEFDDLHGFAPHFISEFSWNLGVEGHGRRSSEDGPLEA